MSASFCDYCSFGKCDIDDEECEYDNHDYEDECHKFLKKKKKRCDDDDDHDDDDDSGLLGLGLGIASITLGGSSGGFGGFGGGGFGGGGGGGKF